MDTENAHRRAAEELEKMNRIRQELEDERERLIQDIDSMG